MRRTPVVFPSTEDAECIDKLGKVIPGLYVAGEAAGPAPCGTIRFRDAEKPALTSTNQPLSKEKKTTEIILRP